MGILDEAIREHLELKRRHGADDSELRELEDDAFGAAERPGDVEAAADPLAEAPTEFMATLDAVEEAAEDASAEPVEEPPPREASDIAALQEAPASPVEPAAEEEEAEDDFEPAEEEQPAMEHEIVPEPPESSGPSTEEREVIADQPTEMYDVEAEIGRDEAPSDEQIVEEEISEPRLAPVDPLAGANDSEEEEEEEDDDFWDEQRLSDELSQALEAPVEEPEEEETEAEPAAPAAPADDEDILEDTPDFLEDSEDDRLWFEQKPPKDFDFDD